MRHLALKMSFICTLVYLVLLHSKFSYSLAILPFATAGRWILDSGGNRFTYAGANWPGHISAMIPEGLQYQSIEQIVEKVKKLGMNSIRLTYATEMVDDIMERKSAGNLLLKGSLVKALGEIHGVEVFQHVLKNNPIFNEKTTRLEVGDLFSAQSCLLIFFCILRCVQVFDAVAAECEKQKVLIHLDNHISKANWCCDTEDDNSWPGDKEFDIAEWMRGWRFMANYVSTIAPEITCYKLIVK